MRQTIPVYDRLSDLFQFGQLGDVDASALVLPFVVEPIFGGIQHPDELFPLFLFDELLVLLAAFPPHLVHVLLQIVFRVLPLFLLFVLAKWGNQ